MCLPAAHSENLLTGRFYDYARHFYSLLEPCLRTPRSKLIKAVNAHAPGDLLEIGVGNGAHLAGLQAHQITGIDVSAAMLKEASQTIRNAGTKLLLMDGEQLSFPDHSFDYVVLSYVLSVTNDPARMLQEARRVLRTRGLLFVLNHETPANWLRYIDSLARMPGRLLRLRTRMHLEKIPGWQDFETMQTETCGLGGYFKIATLRK